MKDLKRFLWQKHDGNTYLVTDRRTGKEFFVNKNVSGSFTIDGCTLTDIRYGQEIPHYFKNKFEVMEYLKEVGKMENKSNVLRKMTMKINRIERFGAIALEENQIITCQKFYDMERYRAMSFLMNVITDLKNMRSQFKTEGKITFYSNNYIELFKSIGMTVQENTLTYDHKHIAFLKN